MQLIAKENEGDQGASKEGIATAQVTGTCLITCFDSNLIIDSGATNHICCNLDLFELYKVFDKTPNTITVANGKQVHVEHIRTVIFENGVKLENVLHVPGVKFNLISTHKLCQDLSCTIVFTKDKCLLQGYSQKEFVVLGMMDSGLYAMIEEESSKIISAVVRQEDAKL
ncbi:Retrovirus-related Pol polyprotein from transposon RE1 [Bienertia sinuspersici]